MSVTVKVELSIKPELYKEWRPIFKQALKDTRNFKGCNGVQVFSVPEESKYIAMEDFDSQEDFNSYINWREAHSGQLMSEYFSAPLKISICHEEPFGYES